MLAFATSSASAALFSSQTFLEGLVQNASSAPVLGSEGSEIAHMALQALRGDLEPGVVGDRVYRRFAITWGRSIPKCRVVEGETVEFHADERDFTLFDPVDMPTRLGEIGQKLGKTLVHKGRGRVELAIEPLSRMEKSVREVFGTESGYFAPKIYLASGEITIDEANEGHDLRLQQIALSLTPLFLEEVDHDVPSFIYAFHDGIHFVDVSGMELPLLDVAVSLAFAVSGLPAEFQDADFVQAQRRDLAGLSRVNGLSLSHFLDRAFYPWHFDVQQLRYQLLPSHEREHAVDLLRRYPDQVFDRWIPLMPEDRRPGLSRHRETLKSRVEEFLSRP